MKKLTYKQIRAEYLNHLLEHSHQEIPSTSLVPENDPTVLYVPAGMLPLVPFLLGEIHPMGTRLTNSQRCIRTVDIEVVGDPHHCTSFEMLGNWSLNDYFKEEAINITVSFLVEKLGYQPNELYASVFVGDEDAPKDNESIRVWKSVFKKFEIKAETGGAGKRIQEFGKKECWWELPEGGPCGPCSEIFYDTGKEPCSKECNLNCDCGKYIELGNNVFMEYLKKDDKYSPLGRHNVDFGGGLDRLAMISQGVGSFYETDIYKPILDKVRELSKEQIIQSERIVVDHIKAATWIIMDGVVPGRSEREYILRRIIRRAVRHARKLGIQGTFTKEVAEVAISQFAEIWVDLENRKEMILKILEEEEIKFNSTLAQGIKEVEKMVSQISSDTFENKDGESFKLYETHGFPPEMLIEELHNSEVKVNEGLFWENHNKAFQEHQTKSRTAAKGFFKGGLADTSDKSVKLHTATHLLLASLYKILGAHIYQKGSNITPERLRLDFPNETKLTDEQIKQVEDMVNEQIQKELEVSWEEMPKEAALEKVPYAAFEDRYQDILKVYTIGGNDPFSIEICMGPHVENTKDLGKFRILKVENVGAGIKRIKAVLE